MHTRSKRLILYITRVAIFGAIATILYAIPVFQVKIPIFPSFLELHFDEIPSMIAGFAYGPLVAFGSIVLKTIIKLPLSSTLCVGELTDLILSCAFIIPAALFYKHRRKFSGALIGISIGLGSQLLISFFVVMLVSLPFYTWLFGITEETLLSIVQTVNPLISDLKFSYGVWVTLPFNAIKDGCVIVATLLIYKAMRRIIEKAKESVIKKKIKKDIINNEETTAMNVVEEEKK